MRISVIMPVYLEPYEVDGRKSASDPEFKFMRAVQSFIEQSFQDAELIIIADGCLKAEAIYKKYFSFEVNIRFKRIEKQSQRYAGKVRQTGIEMAQGEIIIYLDHDDFIGKNHLKIISENFDTDKYGWVYYNDYLIVALLKGKDEITFIANERPVSPQLFYIGTSMISHKRNLNVIWPDGYTHDWRMIESCLLPHLGIKIPTAEYYVCHFHPNDF